MPNCTLPETKAIYVPRFQPPPRRRVPSRDPVVAWLVQCARLARRLGVKWSDYIEQIRLIRAGCTITRATAAARMAEAQRAPTEDQIEKWRMDR